MAVKDVFKLSWKTFFNPSAWLDFSFIKQFNLFLFNSLRGMRAVDQPDRHESFKAAMKRQGLDEAAIQRIYNDYTAYSLFFVVFAILLLVFSLYLLFFHASLHGWAIALGATAISLAQAFRYDFWAFQIKKRKLGCTLKEWRTQRFRKGTQHG